jgi:predicted nuclease of predicted toxin-antitoxin system
MRFLIDENAPIDLVYFLRDRGHEAEYVGEAFAKSSPHGLLLSAAEIHGYIVITFDKDFKRLLRQVPAGRKTVVEKMAGRISFSCRESQCLPRLRELIDHVEQSYEFATSRWKRFVIQISQTSVTMPI